MPILNMVGGGKKGGNIGEPLNLTVTKSGLDATITWEDNEILTIPPTIFQKSELVRKIGSAPTSPSDGTLVVTETVKDTYKTTGYVDQGLTIGETYYYRVFSYSDLGGISYCDAVSVTPSNPWQPGANTIAYYPLTSQTTVNDMSGNNRNLTNNGVQFGEYAGANCGYFNGSSYLAVNSNPITGSSDFTAVSWFYNTQNSSGWQNSIAFGNPEGSNAFSTGINDNGRKLMVGGWNNDRDTGYVVPLNTWICCVMSHSGGTIKTYVNGNLINTSTVSFDLGNSKTRIGCGLSNELDKFYGYIGGCIIEDKVRTAQEISDYYDLTKGDYGIS